MNEDKIIVQRPQVLQTNQDFRHRITELNSHSAEKYKKVMSSYSDVTTKFYNTLKQLEHHLSAL